MIWLRDCCRLLIASPGVPLTPHSNNELRLLFQLILSDVCRAIWSMPVERSAVIEMESCHPNKWSRHLLVGLPGCAFLSAQEAGAFVKDAVLKHRDASKLLVQSTQVSFVDASVYSRYADRMAHITPARARLPHHVLLKSWPTSQHHVYVPCAHANQSCVTCAIPNEERGPCQVD